MTVAEFKIWYNSISNWWIDKFIMQTWDWYKGFRLGLHHFNKCKTAVVWLEICLKPSLWKWGFEFEFVNCGRASKPLVKENKNYQVNTLENKSIAKIFTIAQLKEFLDIHENTIIKTFTNRIKNLESKIKGEMKALQEPTEFQNET